VTFGNEKSSEEKKTAITKTTLRTVFLLPLKTETIDAARNAMEGSTSDRNLKGNWTKEEGKIFQTLKLIELDNKTEIIPMRSNKNVSLCFLILIFFENIKIIIIKKTANVERPIKFMLAK